ncbi:MAG: hypothetical protein QOF51_3794, partial [Chloroflexota bacterium]|nr:hypothetical protein [Chloroflexota bacterium]
VVGVLVAGDAEFMHVRRYGPGHDDLYVPILAIDRVEGDRVYLRIPWIELAAQPWHERPAGAVERRSTGTAGSSSSAA